MIIFLIINAMFNNAYLYFTLLLLHYFNLFRVNIIYLIFNVKFFVLFSNLK